MHFSAVGSMSGNGKSTGRSHFVWSSRTGGIAPGLSSGGDSIVPTSAVQAE